MVQLVGLSVCVEVVERTIEFVGVSDEILVSIIVGNYGLIANETEQRDSEVRRNSLRVANLKADDRAE